MKPTKFNPNYKSTKHVVKNDEYHVSGIDDISNKEQYNKLVLYCRQRIFILRFIYVKTFATPQDILAEVFIRMADEGVFNYNADQVIYFINRTIFDMWESFCLNNPKIRNRYLKWKRKYNIEFKKYARQYLTEYYIKTLLQQLGHTQEEMKSNPDLVKNKRQEIIDRRNGTGRVVTKEGVMWNKEEDKFLEENYGRISQGIMARQLGRTVKSVEKRLARLKHFGRKGVLVH